MLKRKYRVINEQWRSFVNDHKAMAVSYAVGLVNKQRPSYLYVSEDNSESEIIFSEDISLCIPFEDAKKIKENDFDMFVTVESHRGKDLQGSVEVKSKDEIYTYLFAAEDAREVHKSFCVSPILIFDRYSIATMERNSYFFGSHKRQTWILDVYYGVLKGTVTCEVELQDENEDLIAPPWVSEKLIYESSYSYADLILNPRQEEKDYPIEGIFRAMN